MEAPRPYMPVLAYICHRGDDGYTWWYEVIFALESGSWCPLEGSDTFEDGEEVLDWVYCKDVLRPNPKATNYLKCRTIRRAAPNPTVTYDSIYDIDF